MKKKTAGRIISAAAGTTAGVAAFFAGSSYRLFRDVLSRERKNDENSDEKDNPFDLMQEEGKRWALEHKDVCTRVTIFNEGCELTGYYYDQGSEQTVLLVPGLYSNYLNRLVNGDLYYSKGYNILAVDLRGHGESGGKYCTMGYLESEDIVRWTKYLVDQQRQKSIILDGVSMGASSVLAASGHPDLPNQVAGIVSDCGFTSIKDVFQYQFKNVYHVPVLPMMFYAKLYAKYLGGFSLTKNSPLERVRKAKMPILFIHGKEDRFVPYAMSVQLYQACRSKKQFLGIEKAGHALSSVVNPIKYQEEIEKFLENVSKEK